MSLPLLSSGAQCRHASTEWPGLDWFWWQNAWGHKLELHGLAGIHPSIRPTFLLHSCFRNSMKQFSCQSFCFPMKYNDIAGLLARRGEAVAAKSCSRPGNSVPHECVQKSYIYIYTVQYNVFFWEVASSKKTAQDWRICYISVSLQNGDSYDPRCVWPCQQHQSFISCSPNGLHLIIHCKHLTTRMILLGTPCGFRQTSCNMLVL
jgi:hypothetical protein